MTCPGSGWSWVPVQACVSPCDQFLVTVAQRRKMNYRVQKRRIHASGPWLVRGTSLVHPMFPFAATQPKMPRCRVTTGLKAVANRTLENLPRRVSPRPGCDDLFPLPANPRFTNTRGTGLENPDRSSSCLEQVLLTDRSHCYD